jgi:hypothetical protein
VTQDSDFGELIFRHRAVPPPAVIYLRFPVVERAGLVRAITDALEGGVAGWLVVCTPDNRRRRRLPVVTLP